MEEPPPLILCMENASGGDVTMQIEPYDSFQAFLDKAKSLLGYDVDISSITANQRVSLTDNVYQFLIANEHNITDTEPMNHDYEQIIPNAKHDDDQVYILKDGTQIRASQIHFDNDDPLIDITVENIPFVKYIDGDVDEVDPRNVAVEETRVFNIIGSPILKNKHANTKFFANTLPFKLVCNNTSSFEAQFTKFLEGSATKVATKSKSPRNAPDNSYKNYEDNLQVHRKSDNFSYYTREEILNMCKDSPVASIPYNNQGFGEKRRHVRKSDPSGLYRNWNSKPISNVDVDGMLIGCTESQNCFICDKYFKHSFEKVYLFDNEDQRLHRTSPQDTISTQPKIICGNCLDENFRPSRMKSPNQSLNTDEYLVIRNNQQYVFQKTRNFNFKNDFKGGFTNLGEAKAIIDSVESSKVLERTEYVKVEFGTDGEIVTKPIGCDVKSDDVIVVKDEVDSSSDVEIIENDPDLEDNTIDNLDEASEDIKEEFLGKYQSENSQSVKELICRFCERIFANVQEVIDHAETHKHNLEDDDLYPCPLCDYGYEHFKWLRGHLEAAHDNPTDIKEEKVDAKNNDDIEKDSEPTPPKDSSPIAKRTRSAIRKTENGDVIKQTGNIDSPKETPPKQEDARTESPNPRKADELVLKTEVKQESLHSSDDEIWILQTGDYEAEQQFKKIFGTDSKTEKAHEIRRKHKCNICSQLFVTSDELAAHKIKCHRVRKRKGMDDDCIQVPSSEDFMKRARGRPRVNEHGDLLTNKRKPKAEQPTSDPQIVTCHNCNESFTSKVRLKFHIQFHDSSNMLTENGQYACSECNKATFATETELFDHVHFQHKQKRWQCPVKGCGKTFYLRATLTKHSRIHTDTRRYVCNTCGKRFLDKQTLDEHGVTHLLIKPYQCHICLKQLTRRSRLRMHLRAHEEALCPRLVLVCAVCARAFRDSNDVQDHLTRSPECIDQFASELKEESDTVTVQLSPSSGTVQQTVQVNESPKLSKPIHQQIDGADAEALLSQLSDEARSIVRVVQIDKAFRCEYCEDVFYSEDGLNQHRVIHKGIRNPFTCHICKVSFATYSRCTTHKTTHGFYKRPLADAKREAGKSPSSKQEAGPSSTGILGYGDFPVVKHFLCEDCGRSYLHWTYLQVHRRMKHATDSYKHQCPQCELTFPNSWGVTYHKKKMHSANTIREEVVVTAKSVREDYRIPCRDCDEFLPNKTALYKHRKKEHSDDTARVGNKAAPSGVFRCGTCAKQYSSRAGLEAHFRCHPARSAACAKCGHSFPDVAELHSHLKLVHGHELDHPCTVCAKSFCSRAELSVHARVHNPARHACPVCAHAFRTATLRAEHMRTHTGERPYPCDVCGIAFRRSTAMRNHRLIHTGERPWACGRCPKRFRIRSDLRTHIRLKHPTRLVLIEVAGLNPTPDEVMRHLALNNIRRDKVVEITKMSFPKGASSIVPSTSHAYSMLANVPRTQIACSRPLADIDGGSFQPARRGRGIAKNPRRLMMTKDDPQANVQYPVVISVSSEGEEIPQLEYIAYPVQRSDDGDSVPPEFNMQLLQDEVLGRGDQLQPPDAMEPTC